MSEETRSKPPSGKAVTIALLLLLILAACYLFYGRAFESGYGGIAALLLIPAAIGGLITQLSDPMGSRSQLGCFIWPTVGMIALMVVVGIVAREGVICIAMIFPLWLAAALTGAAINRWNAVRWEAWQRDQDRLYSAAWLALPLMVAMAEQSNPPAWTEEAVTREVLIDAPLEKVWPLLVSIPAIDPKEGKANFTQDILGVPRPAEAILTADSKNLVRRARWGAHIRFEERIDEWIPGRSIGWKFLFPDDSVQNHTDRHISPDGPILKILSGRYELTPLAPGKTRVRLTTRYKMRTRLPPYLSWWGDTLLGDIQENVLEIVKDRASKA